MANPNIPKPIGFTVDSTAIKEQIVVILNETTGERITVVTEHRTAVIDAQNFDSGYTDGDILSFYVNGESFGSSTITIDDSTFFQDLGEISTTQNSTTNCVAVNL